MNNKIKQLAEQSGAWEHFNSGNEKDAIMDQQALENFAKLITLECMNVFEADIDSWNQMEPFKASMKRRGSHAMASHFGIV